MGPDDRSQPLLHRCEERFRLPAGIRRAAEGLYRAEPGVDPAGVNAGVTIGMGSDAMLTMFGQNTRELAWFVKAGMTPSHALGSATTVGAALLGMADRAGPHRTRVPATSSLSTAIRPGTSMPSSPV